jgi:hypothetical protein
MIEEPGAIWKDVPDPNRTSSGRRCQRFGEWLEQLKPVIPARAYHGGRGWAYAKLVAHDHKLTALGLYLNAVLRGCYRPSLAVIVFLQIFLGRSGYRALADRAISWLRIGLRDGDAKPAVNPLEQA